VKMTAQQFTAKEEYSEDDSTTIHSQGGIQ
jgi:hypothetical protein